MVDGGMMTWRGHHMQDIVLNLLCYGHYGVVRQWSVHYVHRLLLILHSLPGTLTR